MSPIPFFQRHPRADLSAYLDGELKSGALLRLEAHLAACTACTAELEGLREARSVLRAIPETAAPRSFALTPEMARSARPVRPAAPAPRLQPLVNGLRMASGGLAVALAVVLIVGVSGSGDNSSDDTSSERNLESAAEQYSAALPTATIFLTQSDPSVEDAGDAATTAPLDVVLTPTPTLASGSTPVASGGSGGGVGGSGGSGGVGGSDIPPASDGAGLSVPTIPAETPVDTKFSEADQGSDDAGRNSETGAPDAVSGQFDSVTPVPEANALSPAEDGGGTSLLTIVTILLGALLAAALIGSIAASRLARKTP